VIHGSGKVHEEEQRDVDLCAEATVREANASRLNELGRRGLVRVVNNKNLRILPTRMSNRSPTIERADSVWPTIPKRFLSAM
jgi:hypothetical protein